MNQPTTQQHTPECWSANLELHSSGGDMMGLGDSNDYIVLHTANNEANARLIAAAPELLAALKRSEQYLVLAVADSSGNLKAITQNDLNMIRAAIAKAEGRS